MLILGIESSCDETAAAVLADGTHLLSNVINSQVKDHGKYGGVVPEIASRKHLENIYPVVEEALTTANVSLQQIDGLAVTQGPGLVGSLLVGLSFVKSISLVRQIPYVGINHITAHLLAPFLEKDKPDFPYVALVVSGGHSSIFYVTNATRIELMARTRDDAAGEAFDKVGKLLGLTYPGGPIIGKLAGQGNSRAHNFPRAWLAPDSLDFSFSGIKTAVANYVRKQKQKNITLNIPDICASFQEAIVAVLVKKTIMACRQKQTKSVVLAGGVGANQRLRQLLTEEGGKNNLKVFAPSPRFCTDNAAMIAMAGHFLFNKQATLTHDMDVYSRTQYPSNS